MQFDDPSISPKIVTNLVETGKVDEIRERSRSTLAIKLLYVFAVILSSTIIISTVLIWFEKLSFDNALTLILAISSTFSGLLASAITFYFSSKE